MRTTIRLVLGAAILLVAMTALAQDASLVRVNVLVTETSRDRAVRGLAKENFQIWEDAVAQTIVSVTEGTTAGEYVIAYKSTNEAKDGKWRKLRAKVDAGKGLDGIGVAFSVLFQQGYFAPGPVPGN